MMSQNCIHLSQKCIANSPESARDYVFGLDQPRARSTSGSINLGLDQFGLDQFGLDQFGLDQFGLDQFGLDQLNNKQSEKI